jgi:2,4-dienoyl-CoA reductase-like NADH-dependent reductase (Old Yellow Enzyme family)
LLLASAHVERATAVATRNAMSAVSVMGQPLTLQPSGQVLKNRLVKSAMSEGLADRDGCPTPELIALYAAWAQGGIGQCITGNVMIDGRAQGEPGNVVIEDERHLSALTAWATAATAHDTRCWVQLNHPGKQAPKGLNAETVAPSAIPFETKALRLAFATPRALTDAEVHGLVTRFATAAAVVQRAGFSGVQIHGAHGYLVSQFLSPRHNQRTDDWGGDPVRRRHFVLEVLRAMRAAVGPAFPIGIKLNSADFQRGGFSEDDSIGTIVALAEAGIDQIEVSGGTYEAPVMTGVRRESTRQREAYFLDFAAKARQAVRTPLVVTGGFRTAQGMADAIRSGAIDSVGLARALAVEPDLPNRLLAGLAPRFAIVPRTTGVGFIDRSGMLETLWYSNQLKRIARGEPPRPTESAWRALAVLLWTQLRAGKFSAPKRLRA